MSTEKSPKVLRNILLFIIFLLLVAIFEITAIRQVVPLLEGNSIQSPSKWGAPKSTYRISTYNIQRGKNVDKEYDLAATARVLQGADIIGLNEVSGENWLGRDNLAKQLGEMLDMGWLFTPKERRWFLDYFGGGLLSRYPVNSWRSEPLIYDDRFGEQTKPRSRSPRNLVRANIDLNGEELVVFIAHLDRGPINSAQLRQIFDEFEEYDRAVLIGDLNVSDWDETLTKRLLHPENTNAVAELIPNAPKGYVDYIITRGVKLHKGGMTPKGVSDHPNFWVDVSF